MKSKSDFVVQVVAGQTAALALKKVKRNQVRKGMVLVDERAKPKASWEFDADIAILTHSTTIQPRYQVWTGPCTFHYIDHAVTMPLGRLVMIVSIVVLCVPSCIMICRACRRLH